jgi:hypothetical protein
VFAIYLLSAGVLTLFLGFFALLRQTTYLDAKTNAPIEIELPIFGRMKTNYPAVIFLFIAALFGYLGYLSRDLPRAQWSVVGSVAYPNGTLLDAADWKELQINVVPSSYNSTVNKDNSGRFTIAPALLDGINFEDEITSVIFSLNKSPYLSCRYSPKQELDNWNDQTKHGQSLLRDVAQHSRLLKGVKLDKYDSGDPQC